MKYYTYLHRRKDNNEIFYIGQGSKLRAFRQYHHDNKNWHQVADVVGYTVEIIDYYNTKEEALEAEFNLIQQYRNTGWLVNRVGGRVKPFGWHPNTKRKNKAKVSLKDRGYTLLHDIWVKLDDYNSRLTADPVTGCLEVTSGGLHSQGYMMIGVVHDHDKKRTMTVGARIAGRLKAKRALTSEDFVVKTCGNSKCHNLEHLIIGSADTAAEYRKLNNPVPVKPTRPANRRRYDRADVPQASEVTYVLNHTIEESMARFGWTKKQVRAIQYNHNRGRYSWLKHFDANTDTVLPEWRWLYGQ